MHFQQLLNLVTYRIEPNAGGGFVAYASDPNEAPVQAATRAELQDQIHVNIREKLATAFPGLRLPLEQNGTQIAFHIERKPDGSLVVHTNDGSEYPLPGGNHPEIQNAVMDKVMDVLSRRFAPELTKAFAAQAVDAQLFSGGTAESASEPITPNITINAKFKRSREFLDPSSAPPFAPESSSLWPFIRLLILALIVGALIYFFRHR